MTMDALAFGAGAVRFTVRSGAGRSTFGGSRVTPKCENAAVEDETTTAATISLKVCTGHSSRFR